MKRGKEKNRQAGFVLIEVVLMVILIACLCGTAIPAAMQFYREMAIEYEAEHLLSDIRRTQALSRMLVERTYGYGGTDNRQQEVEIELGSTGYTMLVTSGSGGDRVIHTYLPLVKVSRQSNGEGAATGLIAFKSNGELKNVGTGMMTLLVVCEGWPQEGRKIMISRAGRVRIERVSL